MRLSKTPLLYQDVGHPSTNLAHNHPTSFIFIHETKNLNNNPQDISTINSQIMRS